MSMSRCYLRAPTDSPLSCMGDWRKKVNAILTAVCAKAIAPPNAIYTVRGWDRGPDTKVGERRTSMLWWTLRAASHFLPNGRVQTDLDLE